MIFFWKKATQLTAKLIPRKIISTYISLLLKKIFHPQKLLRLQYLEVKCRRQIPTKNLITSSNFD